MEILLEATALNYQTVTEKYCKSCGVSMCMHVYIEWLKLNAHL